MEFAFRATVLTLTVVSASVAFGQQTRPASLAQFLGMSRSGGHCNSGCCPTPEPTCCAPEPTCCAEPACEPTCCPEPSCGCEQDCCQSACSSCCNKRQYPLESLLSRMNQALCRNNNRCMPCRSDHRKMRDPCGYDLWPCVGECCNTCPGPHGHSAPHGEFAPPATMDPGLLRPHDERRIDPFQDDPDQPPRPPMAPAALRGARLHPAIQRSR